MEVLSKTRAEISMLSKTEADSLPGPRVSPCATVAG
jgi:hypothetical protein